MEKNTVELTIDGVVYTITEIPARIMLPLVARMSEEETNYEVQFEMMGQSVTVNGEAIDAGDLGTSKYMKILSAVMSINGLDEAEGAEGND